jgi:sodium-dependent dicarboxylate transporter 2/3/5
LNISKSKIGLVLGPLMFLTTLLFFKPDGLSTEGIAVLAAVLWIAIWWITEAVPIPVSALLPIVLFPLSGGLSLKETTASYGHKYIFLFIGGFILSIAMER